MKKAVSACVLLLISLYTFSQKVINDVNAEVRNVSNFHSVSVSSGIDLYLSQGNEAMAVSASKPEYRDKIKTEVVNGVLKIYYDYKSAIGFSGDKKLKAYVSYKTLKSLSASGGSDVDVDGTIKAENFALSISGGSDFKGSISATTLKVDQSGGSDVKISGSATRVSIEASGGSDFNGYGLNTDVAVVEASGGSDIEITANTEISARASGASDISYKGKAVLKDSKQSGASSIHKRS